MVREDIELGLRLIRRRPAFAAAVTLLLALGIGATTAVFSLVDAVLLRPLPYPSPQRLAIIWETEVNPSGVRYRIPVKPPWFVHWRDEARSFESMAAFQTRDDLVAGGDEPERIDGVRVTNDLFQVLRAEAALGRTLLAEDDRPGAPPVAVLSDRLWRRSFGASPDVLGRTMELDGEVHTVVGVMPPGFNLLTPWTVGRQMEIFTPLPLAEMIADEPSVHSVIVLGRLADGATLEQAQAEMEAITAAIGPETSVRHGVRAGRYHDELVGRGGNQVRLLFGAAAFVLLIVCANAGGLLLAKTAARRGELAIRSSLGAGRGRLIRQLLVENLPLGVLGGLAGAGAAAWGVRVLHAVIPPDIPRAREMAVDGSMLAFTAGVTVLAVVLLGLAPALSASRIQPAAWLRQGRGTTAGPGRGRRLLIAVQLALTLVLAHGAALMLTSWAELQQTEQGYDPRVSTLQLTPTGPRWETLDRAAALLRAAGLLSAGLGSGVLGGLEDGSG